MKRNLAAVFMCSTIVLSAVCACSSEKSYAQRAKRGAKADASQTAAGGCDASLWNHVYNPTRLQQVTRCVSVTGVIEESNAEPDGDQHFLLKLDPGQPDLMNKRNVKKKNGDLVLEIVCVNPITVKKVKSACAGYTNRVAIPKVGTHVRATGTYVIDSHNGWAEIHPVSKLESI
ncbi:MAG: hypothetical protein M3Z18_01405 [Gemmatimonadota bacterium]|nr:hypothetical protein [Gemmatimonadota bacterium]